jgi:glycoprotein endo-alpha-1,2-mannosidase
MRRIACLVALTALLWPVAAHAGASQVSIFYYPWYGTLVADGHFSHWGQHDHLPPDDIAAAFYPARGIYSSSDPRVLDTQMTDIASMGVGEVAVSWWGWGSPEDRRLESVLFAARVRGLSVAIHLEPYEGRTGESTQADIEHLRTLGIQTFYLYEPLSVPVEDWAAMNANLRDVTVYAQTGYVGYAKKGGFAGIYTYDLLTWGGPSFARICAAARANGILCAPSIGPGYDARRGSGDERMKSRRAGGTYDAMWRAAITAGADRVTITSYNEWHEGTQIEPAASVPRRGAVQYETYDGAYGLRGISAQSAYLRRTAYWTHRFGYGFSSLTRLLEGL